MPGRFTSIEQTLTMLAETPPRIAAITSDLTPTQLRTTPNPDEWSANDVLAHLRSCANVWGDCIAKIIAKGGLTLQTVSPRTWIKQTDYLDLDFRPSLHSITTQRADLLAILEPLPHEDWSHAATLTGAGAVLVRTVRSYAERLAIHERPPHLKQIERIVNSMHT